MGKFKWTSAEEIAFTEYDKHDKSLRPDKIEIFCHGYRAALRAPYPAEVQAVLDAAVSRRAQIKKTLTPPTNALDAAVDAYLLTLTPQPDLEKLKEEMESAAKYHLDLLINDPFYDGKGASDYVNARRAYEAAVRQTEEREENAEKAQRITDATEAVLNSVGRIMRGHNSRQYEDFYNEVIASWKALQELKGAKS